MAAWGRRVFNSCGDRPDTAPRLIHTLLAMIQAPGPLTACGPRLRQGPTSVLIQLSVSINLTQILACRTNCQAATSELGNKIAVRDLFK